VIREEYRSLYEVLESETEVLSTKGVVVTGQPGIGSYECWCYSQVMLIPIPYLGKSTFLIYLLLYRLEQKLPTAVQLNNIYYAIFDEQGATFRSTKADDSRLGECWALTDSNEFVTQPCIAFMRNAPFIVQTTSPRPERWTKWVKQHDATWIIMDLPSVPEMAAVL